MLSSTFVLLAAGLAGFVSAQDNNTAPGQYDYPYLLDPNDALFTAQNRSDACRAQVQSCPQLCANGAFPNNCNTTTLTWQCKCNDGTFPNVTAFEQTLPFFECQQFQAECVSRTDVAEEQLACRAQKCGSEGSPADYASQISMSAAATRTSSSTPTSSATTTPTSEASPAATTTNAAIALTMGNTYGTSALMAGIFGLFGFML